MVGDKEGRREERHADLRWHGSSCIIIAVNQYHSLPPITLPSSSFLSACVNECLVGNKGLGIMQEEREGRGERDTRTSGGIALPVSSSL